MCKLHLIMNFFFFNDTVTTEIYTLSLHDALPILTSSCWRRSCASRTMSRISFRKAVRSTRSEEHTSELQSHLNLVCRLLLEYGRRIKESWSAISLGMCRYAGVVWHFIM